MFRRFAIRLGLGTGIIENRMPGLLVQVDLEFLLLLSERVPKHFDLGKRSLLILGTIMALDGDLDPL